MLKSLWAYLHTHLIKAADREVKYFDLIFYVSHIKTSNTQLHAQILLFPANQAVRILWENLQKYPIIIYLVQILNESQNEHFLEPKFRGEA